MKISTSIYDPKKNYKDIFFPSQIHGNRVVEIISGEENFKDCDALFTKNFDFSLGIRTADCAAVCIDDGETVGIIHIGWRGLCNGIYEKMIKHFNQNNLEVQVSPFLHRFEIKKDFCFDEIFKKFGESFFIYSEDKIIFDFKLALQFILPVNATFDTRNTKDDLTLPSHRRNGTEERILTVVGLK